MIDSPSVVAVIPARGGSKGLPGKNIRELAGKPLIAHSIEVAKKCAAIDRVIVSTDAEDIAHIAVSFGAEVVNRPAHLATNDALVADALHHLKAVLDSHCSVMVLLETTSPIRSVEMIDHCISQVLALECDSIATFIESEPPLTRLWKITEGAASPLIAESNPWLPRQKQDKIYQLTGQVYAFNYQMFVDQKCKSVLFGKTESLIVRGPIVDIDTLDDFLLAEHLISKMGDN